MGHIIHEQLHSYYAQNVQALEPGNYDKRIKFARRYLQESSADTNFTANVLFMDEA